MSSEVPKVRKSKTPRDSSSASSTDDHREPDDGRCSCSKPKRLRHSCDRMETFLHGADLELDEIRQLDWKKLAGDDLVHSKALQCYPVKKLVGVIQLLLEQDSKVTKIVMDWDKQRKIRAINSKISELEAEKRALSSLEGAASVAEVGSSNRGNGSPDLDLHVTPPGSRND